MQIRWVTQTQNGPDVAVCPSSLASPADLTAAAAAADSAQRSVPAPARSAVFRYHLARDVAAPAAEPTSAVSPVKACSSQSDNCSRGPTCPAASRTTSSASCAC